MIFDPKKIKLITFDLDDTLWDGTSVISYAEQAMQSWLQVHTPQLAEQLSQADMRARKIAFAKANASILHRVSTVRLAFLKTLFSEFNIENSEQKAEQCFQTFYQARQNVELFDGIESTLQTLLNHYRIGAITNGNSDLSIIGLDHLFEFAYSAEDFPAAKPSPHMFDAALELTGLSADECLHVGDHPKHDVMGAHDAGWQTVWLKDGTRTWDLDFEPGLIIESVNELSSLLT